MKVTSWGSRCHSHHWSSLPKKNLWPKFALHQLWSLYNPAPALFGHLGAHYSRQKQDFTDRCTEESVGEEQLVLWVTGLGRDAQVEEAYPSLQLAGEVHGLRG